jgi:hypothetical protein
MRVLQHRPEERHPLLGGATTLEVSTTMAALSHGSAANTARFSEQSCSGWTAGARPTAMRGFTGGGVLTHVGRGRLGT